MHLLHKQTLQKLWISFLGNKQKSMHTAEVQPTILQLRKTSISKPATRLAYWLQESHKPFCLLVLLILDAWNPLAPFTYIVFFCPSLVEQGFARVSFKPACVEGESGSGWLVMLAEGLGQHCSLASSPLIKSIWVIQITSGPCVQGLRKCPAKGQVGPTSYNWLILVPTGGPGHVFTTVSQTTIHYNGLHQHKYGTQCF